MGILTMMYTHAHIKSATKSVKRVFSSYIWITGFCDNPTVLLSGYPWVYTPHYYASGGKTH